ncbi:hypothetical protein [Paeniglutamicibacter cryotolerans]|uniref:DUF2384 domain-containing protein n=1 Tax=Paeniglutamicibacter cryotolerans TaxID=670079 RepID=A0A839QNY9_9MICC|nr:hypothetical protein [Paeniglutamicibacter cryotolerans]MBB2997637.1 hypothetical protein [Paeniglutamicibacter cryotolerans]
MGTLAERNRTELMESLADNLKALPDEQLEAIKDFAGLARRMAHLVPAPPGTYGNLIGPVYSTKALQAMWDISREAVSKKARSGKLLALKVDGENLFPVFQFRGNEVRADVRDIVKVLRESADPFTVAQWLRTPQDDDAQKRTPLSQLDEGCFEVVKSSATRAAARWSA